LAILNMQNILITGGAGFIGSHLVDRLMADQNNRVIVVDNFHDFYNPSIKREYIAAHTGCDNIELVESNIANAGAMEDLFARSRFDLVVHLAARAGVRPSLADPLAYEETNVRGTYALLEAARSNGVKRFLFGSSSSVYGVNANIPFSEDDPIAQPISPYSATKIAGEAACHAFSHLYGMRIVCLRFFTVYGPRQRPDLAIHKFARLIAAGKPVPIYGDGATRRDYTYIDDIISGVQAAISYDQSQFEIINLGESETVELRRLVEVIERAIGKRAILDRQPEQPGDVPITYANIDKARGLLGYNPETKIEAGIEKFVAWFKQQK
jgi:UDP-glucuronate 4-epimerase